MVVVKEGKKTVDVSSRGKSCGTEADILLLLFLERRKREVSFRSQHQLDVFNLKLAERHSSIRQTSHNQMFLKIPSIWITVSH